MLCQCFAIVLRTGSADFFLILNCECYVNALRMLWECFVHSPWNLVLDLG